MRDVTSSYGNNLLIAMSNTDDSLQLVRTVAEQLDDAELAHITLMHYLIPVYWEHGGAPSDDEELQEILREEEQQLRTEELQHERSRDYFQEAKTILANEGVSESNVRTLLTSDGEDVGHAVLQEIQNSDYTAVVVGEHDRGVLEQILCRSLAEFLETHARDTKIWEISQT